MSLDDGMWRARRRDLAFDASGRSDGGSQPISLVRGHVLDVIFDIELNRPHDRMTGGVADDLRAISTAPYSALPEYVEVRR
jgi:hypothetical protein